MHLFPVVVLYESDIDELVSTFCTSKNSTVSFEHGDSIYDTLAALREDQGDVLREFKLEVVTRDEEIHRARSSVSFESGGGILYCDSAHELQFRQATEFLKARRRWMGKISDTLWFVMQSSPFCISVVAYFNIRIYSDPSLQRSIILYSIAVFGVVSAWLFSRVTIRRNLLFLKKRHEHAGFFRRNESHIVRAAFGVAGGILGYVIRLIQE